MSSTPVKEKRKGPKHIIQGNDNPAVGGVVPSNSGSEALTGIYPDGEIKFRDKDLEFIEELGAGSGGSVSKFDPLRFLI